MTAKLDPQAMKRLCRRYRGKPGLYRLQCCVDALLRCVRVAQADTGQSRIVARGLLSAYNGERFPFDVSDLACLDAGLVNALFNVWWLRHLGYEPHTC